MSAARITALVLATELRGLLRDRRALAMAVVVPMALFPLLFFGMDALEARTERDMAELELVVAHDLERLDEPLRAEVLARIRGETLHLMLEPLPPGEAGALARAPLRPAEAESRTAEIDDDAEARRSLAATLLGSERHLLLVGRTGDASAPRDDPRATLELYFDGSSHRALEAVRRLRGVLAALRDELRLEALERRAGLEPGRGLEPERADVALAEDALGRELGQLLPAILLVMLLSSTSFAALGAFSAEREEGTIETLLVQPVPARAVAAGKLLAVLATGLVAVTGNALSFFVCVALGWGEARGMATELALGASGLRVAGGLLLLLPTALLLSALLCLVAARARSFREGQHYVLPLMLVCGVLAAASTQGRLELGALLALVPVTGATMAMRDALSGNLAFLPALLTTTSTLGLAWIALLQVARALDDERLFSTHGVGDERARLRQQSRRALAWGWTAVGLVYLVGGRIQLAAVVPGVLVTLWVLVPAIALFAVRGTARRAGEGLGRALGLGAPHALHLAGAALLAVGLAECMPRLVAWQSTFLPTPDDLVLPELARSLEELGPVALVLLVGLSPGLMEELLFRGAILSGLRRDLSPWRVMLWQGILFGAVHASVYRFLPSGLMGAGLAALTLWCGRLWPAVVLHVLYNSTIVLELGRATWWRPEWALGAGLLGLGLVALGKRRAF